MSERMSWHDDEGLYQPRIHSRRIRELHQVAQATSIPMTVLIDQALAEFVTRQPPTRCPVEKPAPETARGAS